MDQFISAVIARREGTLTTTTNDWAAVPDGDTGLAYFKTKGMSGPVISYMVETKDLLVSVDVAVEAADKTPKRWHNLWGGDGEWTLTVGEDFWDWLFLRWDFVRVQIKPAVAGQHGKITINISGGSVL